MARPSTDGLTNHELKIMKMFWSSGSQTVQEVVDTFDQKPMPAYSSILTVLRTLQKKGYLTHRQKGKAYVYSAKITRDNVSKTSIGRLMNQLFDGSAFDLAVQVVKAEQLTNVERKRLLDMLKGL